MNKPLLDLKSNYVKYYLEKVNSISKDIVKQDYSDLQEYKMPLSYGYVESGCWYFRIIKSKDTGICLKKFDNSSFEDLINDDNIMCVGVNRLPPGTVIKEHVDPPYYGKNLWRILVPIQASDAYLKGMHGVQKVKEGNSYIFDISYELHHGWNSSKEEDFVIMTIDILYENDSEYKGPYYYNYNGTRIDVANDPLYKKVISVNMEIYEKS